VIELLVKEIVQKVNERRIDNQVIVARKLLLEEIILYIEDKEARIRLKANTLSEDGHLFVVLRISIIALARQ